MKTVFAYTRVSTIRQGTHGSSLAEQKAAISRYADQHGLDVIEWFEEQETAAKRGRPVFSKMLRMLEQGRATGVIIHKIDRSARNLKDWADLAELIDRGVQIHFAHESLDLQSRGGRLAADIQAVVAADYVRNLRDEVKKGMYGRYRQGLYPHRAPLGYVDQGGGKPKTPDLMTAPLVKRAFELYATEEFNLDALRLKVAELGLRGLSGKPLPRSSMAHLLSNEFYVGVIHIERSGERFSGIHEPLVDTGLFETVQQVLKGRKRRTGLTHTFPYRRLIRCQPCGHFLVAERQKGRVYYRCHTKGCPSNTIREDALTTQIENALARIALPQAMLSEVQFEFQRLAMAKAPEQAVLRRRHQLAFTRLEEKIDRLDNSYLDGLFERGHYAAKKRDLLMQMAALKQEIAESERVASPDLIKTKKFLELQKVLYKAKFSNNIAEVTNALKLGSSNLSMIRKKLAVDWKNGLDVIEKWNFSQYGGPLCTTPRTIRNQGEGRSSEFKQAVEKLFRYLTEDDRRDKEEP